MRSIRHYMNLLTDARMPLADTAPAEQQPVPVHRLRQLAGIVEGELIPFPARVLRVAGPPTDMYQFLKMNCNPNLAHKVNFVPAGGSKPGGDPSHTVMCFYDHVSYEETKKLFDHFGIVYSEEAELGSEIGRQKKTKYKSSLNPPSDADELHGQYFKADDHPL